MLVRNTVGFVSAYSGFYCVNAPNRISTTSWISLPSCSPGHSDLPNRRPRWRRDIRCYADVAGDQEDGLHWPKTKRQGTIPTPYEIFNQRKGSPYSKHRFYELVKIYHPDRYGNGPELRSVGHLSQAVRLERYRLIIAANNILSDPVKRNAYDRYGAGWNGFPEAKVSRHQNTEWGSGTWSWQGPEEYRSAFHNATWEDWERWYQRDQKPRQKPVFVANGVFASMMLVLAVVAGTAEAISAANRSSTFIEQRDRMHSQSSQELMRKRKEATSTPGGKDEMIQSFLRTRDSVDYGITDSDEGNYNTLLPDRERGISDDIKYTGGPLDTSYQEGETGR